MPSWLRRDEPTGMERGVGGICYLTCGLAGILYIVLSGRSGQSDFFRFHFLQSIFLGILGLFLNWAASFMLALVSSFVALFNLPAGQAEMLAYSALKVVFGVGYLLLLYGMIASFLGKYAEIPLISRLIRQQLR